MIGSRDKIIIYGLVAILLLLQYPLWFSHHSVLYVWRLQQQIEEQEQQNAQLQQRNLALQAEVVDLKRGLAAIEERARAELGMVKRNETFYQVVEERPVKDQPKK